MKKKNIFSFPANAGGNVRSSPKGVFFYINTLIWRWKCKKVFPTRISGKTDNFQDFIRLEKSVSVLQM